jgi:RNA polymerase sigma factor (sigma-70 family)
VANESSRIAANTPVIGTVLKTALQAARRKLSTRTGYALLSKPDDTFLAAALEQLLRDDTCRQMAAAAPSADIPAQLEDRVCDQLKGDYSKFLYDWLSDPTRLDKDIVYQELGCYLLKIAFNILAAKSYTDADAQATAQDCAQTAQMQLFKKISDLREPRSLVAYARTIVEHECLAAIKRKGPEVPIGTLNATDESTEGKDDLLDILRDQSGDADDTSLVELTDCIERALAHLPRLETRQILHYQLYLDLSDPEIAGRLQLTIANVQQLRSRALRELRNDRELYDCIKSRR